MIKEQIQVLAKKYADEFIDIRHQLHANPELSYQEFDQAEGKGKLIKILFKDIGYVISQKNYLSIVTQEKKYLTYLTLTEIEEKLPPSFLRINKSYIINTNKIRHVEGNEIFLINIKEGFTIGSSYKDAFSNHLKEHLIKTKRF